jgi:glycosyltransferase involved in cell wall biosynthesis
MRILRLACVTNNRTGGMSRTMHATADELRALGHDVQLVFADRFQNWGPTRIHRYTSSIEAARLAIGQVRLDGPFDIVEMHEPLALSYARQRRKDKSLPPLIIFSYGLEERAWVTANAYRKSKRITVPLKSWINGQLTRSLVAHGVRMADHVICSNSADVEYLAKAGVSRDNLTTHQSGIGEAFITGWQLEADRDPGKILFVGTWLDRKGILELVSAFTTVARAAPFTSLTIAGVGDKCETCSSAFPQDVRRRLRVIPTIINDAELARVYREHSVFVLPSFAEGQPLALIEASACALAPVVTAIDGHTDFVTNGLNGLLVPVGDEASLSDAILELVRNPERAKLLGQQAREKALTQTWRHAAEKLEKVYVRVARRNGSGARHLESVMA